MECLHCGKLVAGRSDKKYCSNRCRNAYNNGINRNVTNYIRNVNNTLRKNRRILEQQLLVNKFTTKRRLLHEGFDFDYFTAQVETKNGRVYTYCYDYGYMELENKSFLVVKIDKADKTAAVFS